MSDIPICLVRCRFRAPDGQPLVGSRVIALLTTSETYNGFIVPQRVEATTDGDGMATLGLWPNQLGSRASSYNVKIMYGGGPSQSARITVPNVDTIDMHLIAELPAYPGKTDGQLIVDEVIAAAAPAVAAKDAAESARDDAALFAENARAKAAEASASAASAADASRLTVGTVTTAPAGSSATATITGQPGAQVLDLTLPAGADGPQGEQGPQGDVGDVNPQMPLILAAAEQAAADAAGHASNAAQSAALLGSAAIVTATGTVALTDTSAVYQLIDPSGANRDVTLPALDSNHAGRSFVVKNAGSGAYALTIKSGATRIGPSLMPGYSLSVLWTGEAWVAL